MARQQPRVAITGIGLVTPLGTSTQQTWQQAIAGRSGVIERAPAFKLDSASVAGVVPLDTNFLDAVLTPAQQRKTDRFMHLACCAAAEAVNDAHLSTAVPLNRARIGVYLGVGLGGLSTLEEGSVALSTQGPGRLYPFMIPKALSSEGAAWISMLHDCQGPSLAVSSACASSADAIGLAYQAIVSGQADVMIAGGAEACVTDLAIAAFSNMRVLSSWRGAAASASRPFDIKRSGFVIAEGAGILVLERFENAQTRGVPIYAELVGYGTASDAFHIAAMHPQGRGAELALKNALFAANVQPHEVGYINAHGTATPMNDMIEAAVIKRVFGDHADSNKRHHLLVSSTKSMMGHTLGAAGGIEAALTALALRHQLAPPTINLDNPDPACEIDAVPNVVRQLNTEYALSNSFGFGGGSVVLALRRVSQG